MSKDPCIERIGFGVLMDKDEYSFWYTHSDRFLVVDLKDRKEVIKREYRPNLYAEICREKYSRPTEFGKNIPDEENEIYHKMAEIVKDCKYVAGKNFGYFPKEALQDVGSDSLMTNEQPEDWIKSLIDNRRLAGFN